MSYQPLTIQEDDYVIPVSEDIPDQTWTPCRVIRLYANGNLWARSDNGEVVHRGPISHFKLAP